MSDDVRLQAAVIAAVSALAVSLVGIFTSFITARSSRKSMQILELAKRTTENEKAKRLLTDDQLRTSLEVMSKSLTAIQYFKDRIQLILMAPESQFDSTTFTEMLSSARDQILEVYATGHPHLATVNAGVLHDAKNLTLEVAIRTSEVLMKAPSASAIPGPTRAYLADARLTLSGVQERLREEMNRILILRCFQ